MANVNNIVEIVTNNEKMVKLPVLPNVAASNIERCHSLLKKFPFNRGVFEDLSCYIVNPEYLAWTVKLRLPVDGEAIDDKRSSGFVPPTQLAYANVLRNYMEKIVPLNYAVGDITIELRFVSQQEMRLWCVDFVMEPVVRNDLPMPPVLPHIQCQQPKPSNAFNPQAKKISSPTVNQLLAQPSLPPSLMYTSFSNGINTAFVNGNNTNQSVQNMNMNSKKRKRKH